MAVSRLATVILIMGVALGIVLRLQAIPLKTTITHDEGISYLAATGHQAEFTELYYDHRAPYGRWVEAVVWKAFIARDHFWCFRKIGSDIASADIHPPLYFWMLHAWLWVVGVHVWSGALMNVIITLLMMTALYRFACYVLPDRLGAAVVVFTWAVSPHVMQESMEGRAYGLLALFALLLAWRTIAVVEARHVRPHDAAIVAIITALGALTHYHFAIAVAGAGIYAAYRLIPRLHEWRLFMRLVAAMAGGYALFFAAHPSFYQSFSRQQSQSQPFDPAALPARLMTCASSLAEYVVHPRAGNAVLIAATALIVCGIIVLLVRRRTVPGPPRLDRVGAVVFFFLWFSAGIVLLYVTFVSPTHAMGSKYLSVSWPFFVFVPVLLARMAPDRSQNAILVALCVWQLAYAAGDAVMAHVHAGRQVSQRTILARADRVLVDTVARGVLPRILFNLPDTIPVYAAMQDHLLESPQEWNGDVTTSTIYVSHSGYGNSQAQAEEILQMLETRHAVLRAQGGLTGIAYYQIQ